MELVINKTSLNAQWPSFERVLSQKAKLAWPCREPSHSLASSGLFPLVKGPLESPKARLTGDANDVARR